MVPATKIKVGMIFLLDGQLLRVVSSEYHSSGKTSTAVTTKLKNMKTGAWVEKHFKQDEKLEEIQMDRRDYEFLYDDGAEYFFMHPETYEQVSLSKDILGPGAAYIKPNSKVPIYFYEEKPVSAQLPEAVELKVTLTAPPQQQETMKTAVLENGIEILVPQFVKTSDIVRIDIQTNKYLERIKEKNEK